MTAEGPYAQRTHSLAGIELEPLSEAVAGVMAEAMAAMQPWSVYGRTASGLAERFKTPAPGLHNFEIRAYGNLAGVTCIQYPWLSGPYLQIFAILPPFRGRQIGHRVMQWMEKEARDIEARQLWLCVSTFNSRAESFYARCGFEAVATIEQLASDTVDERLMRKRLRYDPS